MSHWDFQHNHHHDNHHHHARSPFLKTEKVAIVNSLPLNFTRVKTRLRVERDDENGMIADLIRTAELAFEREHNIIMQTQSYTGHLDTWPSFVEIRQWPVSSVTSVKYQDENDVQQTMPTTDYFVDVKNYPARIRFDEAPTLVDDEFNSIEIIFVAGFADLPNTPPPLLSAIDLFVMELYDCGLEQASGNLPSAVDNLVALYSKKTY